MQARSAAVGILVDLEFAGAGEFCLTVGAYVNAHFFVNRFVVNGFIHGRNPYLVIAGGRPMRAARARAGAGTARTAGTGAG